MEVVHSPAPPSASPVPPPLAEPVGHYTAACRRCGARLRLSEDEVFASLSEAPICWPCDQATPAATG